MTLLLSASHPWSLEEEIKRPHLSPPRLVSDPALSSSSWIFIVFINMKNVILFFSGAAPSRLCSYMCCSHQSDWTLKHKFSDVQFNVDHVALPEDNNAKYVNKLFPVLRHVCSMHLYSMSCVMWLISCMYMFVRDAEGSKERTELNTSADR